MLIKLTGGKVYDPANGVDGEVLDAEGGVGSFQKLHQVYDRAGEPCRKCREPVRVFRVAAQRGDLDRRRLRDLELLGLMAEGLAALGR